MAGDLKLALVLEAKTQQFKQAIAEARAALSGLASGSAGAGASVGQAGSAASSAASGLSQAGSAASSAASGLSQAGGAASSAASGLGQTGAAAAQAASGLNQVGQAGNQAQHGVSGLGNQVGTMQALQGAVAKLVAAFAVVDFAKGFIRAADAMTLLDGKVKLATASTASFSVVKEKLFQIANQTGVSIEDAGAAFSRLGNAVKEAGGTTQDTLDIVKAFGLAAKISGASSQEASNAMVQLAQGMSAGALRGDELNSVLEAAPRFAKALADSMGVSIGALKALGAEGKITAQDIMKVAGQMKVLEQEAAQMGNTVSGAITRLQNAFSKWVGEADSGAGITAGLAGGIDALARNFDSVAKVLTPVLTVLKGAWSILGQLGTVIDGVSGGTGGLGTAFAVLGTALLAMTGPVGALAAGFVVLYKVLERIQGWAGADKLREAAAEGQRLRTVFEGFAPLMEKLNGAGLYGLTEKVYEIQQAALKAGGDGKAAAAATEQYVQKVIAEHTKLADAKEELDKLYARRAKIVAGELEQTEKERVDAQIREVQKLKTAREQELNKALSDLERYRTASANASQRAADARVSTADKIRELRRRDMTESEREGDIWKEAYEKIGAAAQKLQEAQTLASQGNVEGAEKAAQAAQKLAQQGESLGSSLKSTAEGIRIVGQAGDIIDKSNQAVSKANDNIEEKTKQTAEELKKSFDGLEARLDDLEKKTHLVEIDADISKIEEVIKKSQAALDSLVQKDRVEILADGAQALGEIGNVQRELAALKDKTVTVTVLTRNVEAHQAGGPVGGVLHLNRGGRLPGYGGGDRVRALLEAGEYVVRKERARRFGALVHMINTAPLSRLNDLLSGFVGGVQRFAVGGPVMPSFSMPALSGAAGGSSAGGGSRDTVDINFNLGAERFTAQSSRDQARGLARALRELSRG